MSDDGGLRNLLPSNALLLIAVIAGGVLVSGFARRTLGVAGFPNLGRVVYVLGYGGVVAAVWYGWIRPLDISGPTGEASLYDDEESDDRTEL
ncbi:MAG: hypothetical protein ABEJ79_12545 [Halolamina sp.]